MKLIKDVYYGEEKIYRKSMDVYLPDDTPRAAFLYIHGGGLDHGDKEFSPPGEYLTKRGIAYAPINYRMYPEYKYPDFLYDAAEAVAFAKKYFASLGCDKLYVGGSSAGGYISMMLCFDEKYLKKFGASNADVSGYFHDAGQPTAHFTVLKNLGIDSRRVIVDDSCPLYHVGTLDSYPKMRFIISDNDMPSRYEQTMLMLSTLKHFGYTGYDHKLISGTHCAYFTALDQNGESVIGSMILDFIEDALLGERTMVEDK